MELRRFADRFGPASLLDTESRAFKDAGLGYLRMDPDEVTERLLANAGLLKLPLVRAGNDLSIGVDEAAWKRMAAAEVPRPL
jgi:arsenate reductase-like glutaredoxin family protein